MADININFGTEDLDGLRKLLAELQKALETLKKSVQETGVITKETTEQAAKYTNAQKAASTEINKRLKSIQAEEGSVLDLTQKYKLLKKEIEASAKPNKSQIDNLKQIKNQLDAAKKSTNEWGVALNSFQFKFNALGNIAGNVVSGLIGKIGNLTRQFISFEKAINSTDSSADSFERTMGAANAVTQKFFSTLFTGDWSNFLEGLINAAEAGRDYVDTLDDIQNRQRQLTVEEANVLQRQAELTEIWRDPEGTKTVKQRLAAVEELIDIEEKLATGRTTIATAAYEREINNIIELTSLTKEQIEQYVAQYDKLQPLVDIGTEYGEVLKNYTQAQREGNLGNSEQLDKLRESKKALEAQALAAGITASELETYSIMINKFNDEGRQLVVDSYKNMKTAAVSAILENKRLLAAKRTLNLEVEKENKKAPDSYDAAAKEMTEIDEKRTKKIKDELEKRQKLWEDNLAAQLESYEAMNDELKKFRAEDDIFFDKLKDKQEEKDKKDKKTKEDHERAKQAAIEASFETARLFIDLLSVKSESAMNKELQDVDKAEKQKLKNKFLTEDQKTAIEEQAELQRNEIKRKYAKKQQTMAIAMTVVNTAQAIQKTLADGGALNPAAWVAAGLAAGSGALQVAIISAQKFAKGGLVGGKPHSQGGTIIEAEKDEFIVNKSATQKNRLLLEDVNKGKNIAYNFQVEDSYKLAMAMKQDKVQTKKEINYTKELYEWMKRQPTFGEGPGYFIRIENGIEYHIKKNIDFSKN